MHIKPNKIDKKQIVEILPLIDSLAADGPSYSVIRLCESLLEQNLNIQLFNCELTEIDNPPFFLKRFPLGGGPKRLCRSPKMFKWIQDLAIKEQIRLIHSHVLWSIPTIYPLWIGKKYNIPHIISPRGSLAKWAMDSGLIIKKLYWPIFQHKALKNATCLHATSKSEYLDIRRLGFKQPVAIIPNGIDIPDLLVKSPQKMRTLLFLGRINPIKGLDMLLPAWKIIQDKYPDWQLQIVGPDSRGYLVEVKNMADRLNLRRVEFSGLLTGDAKWSAYQNAELFILPSYTENFGVSVAESLASGLPVITTKGTPWSELESHNAGWWVDIDMIKISQCMESAMSLSRSELMNMGQRGRKWMKDDFSWDKIAQMMADTYRWVCKEGGRPECVVLD